MIFIVLTIVCFIILVIAEKKEVDVRVRLFFIVLAFTFMLVGIKTATYAEIVKNDVKDSQLFIAEQYKTSSKTEEDWQKTVSKLKQTNEKMQKAEEQKLFYACVDFYYVICLIFPTTSFNDYTVTIYDNKVVFPEHYKALDLVKGSSQDTTQDITEPTTEATYMETEIDGTKYQLVPIE